MCCLLCRRSRLCLVARGAVFCAGIPACAAAALVQRADCIVRLILQNTLAWLTQLQEQGAAFADFRALVRFVASPPFPSATSVRALVPDVGCLVQVATFVASAQAALEEQQMQMVRNPPHCCAPCSHLRSDHVSCVVTCAGRCSGRGRCRFGFASRWPCSGFRRRFRRGARSAGRIVDFAVALAGSVCGAQRRGVRRRCGVAGRTHARSQYCGCWATSRILASRAPLRRKPIAIRAHQPRCTRYRTRNATR